MGIATELLPVGAAPSVSEAPPVSEAPSVSEALSVSDPEAPQAMASAVFVVAWSSFEQVSAMHGPTASRNSFEQTHASSVLQ